MRKQNPLKTKLAAGKAVLGTWAMIPSAVTADILSLSGLDFIIIDSEHGSIGYETATTMAMACDCHGVSPVMRVGGVDEAMILRALDIGVHCVQVPNVHTAAAAEAVSWAKYPPLGRRGFSPVTRAGDYTFDFATEHTGVADTNTLIAIHIEGEEAIAGIDDILAIAGLDIIFVGVYDLSKALGIPGQVTDERVVGRLRELSAKIAAAGKYPGTIVTREEQIAEVLSYGIKYITYSVDAEILGAGYKSARAALDAATA
jgi:4-hydroxy-2-oxoheptanedioate aldolase